MARKMNSGFAAWLRRDLLLAYRRRGEVASPVLFFMMVSTLIPLGLTPEAARLEEVAAGMIWVMALLATLLSVDGMFASDYRDGSLEQMLITPQLLPLPLLCSLALGTACLSLVGAVGAALTVSLRKGGLLLSLLVMPLYMPVIIFGTATVSYAVDGLNWLPPLALLGALLAASVALCPLAAAGALRVTASN